MTTPATTDKPEKQTPVATSARTRSPAYPAYSLQTSLDRARAVWQHETRNSVPMASLAVAWGTNIKSSTTLLTVASLTKFGLLEDVQSGKERLLKLTQVALNIILNDQEDSTERIGLLKQCALTPKIHAELWKQYNGELPSDTSLKRHLIVEKNFNAASVDGFIKQFRDTISFAKLLPSDKITITETEDSVTQEEMKPETIEPESPKVVQISGGRAVGKSTATGTLSVLREFNFPLPAGVATLKVPLPLGEEDFDMLIKTLNVFKEGMVKTEFMTIDCNVENWHQQATALAESNIEFNLVNFDFTDELELNPARKIAVENSFIFRFYPNNKTAFFRRRDNSGKKQD